MIGFKKRRKYYGKSFNYLCSRNVFITYGTENNRVSKGKGKDIVVDAISATEGGKAIAAAAFDLYLVSPQTKMYFKQFEEAGSKAGKPVVQIPPQAYIPIPMGIEKMANLILENI